MFKQRPQSPESRSDDPKIARITTVSLAVGFLAASIDAHIKQDVQPTTVYTTDTNTTFVEPVYPQYQTKEVSLDSARRSTEKAYNIHPTFSHPAEDITEEFVAAQNELSKQQQGAVIYHFPDRMLQANPEVDNNRRQAA